MKLKILMDSGKEYETTKYTNIQQLIDECFDTQKSQNPLPGKDNEISKFSNKFFYISKDNVINTKHISSIEIIED